MSTLASKKFSSAAPFTVTATKGRRLMKIACRTVGSPPAAILTFTDGSGGPVKLDISPSEAQDVQLDMDFGPDGIKFRNEIVCSTKQQIGTLTVFWK